MTAGGRYADDAAVIRYWVRADEPQQRATRDRPHRRPRSSDSEDPQAEQPLAHGLPSPGFEHKVVPQRQDQEYNRPRPGEVDAEVSAAHASLAHRRGQDRQYPGQQDQFDNGGGDSEPEQVLPAGTRSGRGRGGEPR